MANRCTYCGSQLDEGVKLCPECGRLTGIESAAPKRPATRQAPPPRRVYEHPVRAQRRQAAERQQAARPQQRPAPVSQRPAPVQEPQRRRQPQADPRLQETAKKKKSKHIIWSIVKKLLLVSIIVGAIYAALAFVNISLIKRASYDFGLSMELEQDNYGDAIDVYFKEGSWSFNLFTFTVSYEGKANNGKDYEMKFGREKGQVVVTEMRVNGKKISKKDIMPLYVMGMFNSVEIKTDK